MKLYKITFIIILFVLFCFAQQETASTYTPYPTPTGITYIKAPKGYSPFYLSHYGRHGSRFHQPKAHYDTLYAILKKADSLKKLTPKGKELFTKVEFLEDYASPKAGELTNLGLKQHQGIAKRMFKNFPEIFKDTAYIESFSSTTPRCIVSMSAFLGELKANNPKLQIHQESGKSVMPFICPLDFGEIINKTNTDVWKKENEKLYSHINPFPMMNTIFNDSSYIQNNIKIGDLYSLIFEIGSNLQNIDELNMNFDDLWTNDELLYKWKAQNAWWYNTLGNSPLSKSEGLEMAKPVLKNIIEITDKVIYVDTIKKQKPQKNDKYIKPQNKKISATLRFGHDTVLIPLIALLEIDSANVQTSNMELLDNVWKDYKICPMAGNIQIILYKSTQTNSPILVKLLHNEKEKELPIQCSLEKSKCPKAPYYLWDDFKNYYQQKI